MSWGCGSDARGVAGSPATSIRTVGNRRERSAAPRHRATSWHSRARRVAAARWGVPRRVAALRELPKRNAAAPSSRAWASRSMVCRSRRVRMTIVPAWASWCRSSETASSRAISRLSGRQRTRRGPSTRSSSSRWLAPANMVSNVLSRPIRSLTSITRNGIAATAGPTPWYEEAGLRTLHRPDGRERDMSASHRSTVCVRAAEPAQSVRAGRSLSSPSCRGEVIGRCSARVNSQIPLSSRAGKLYAVLLRQAHG